MVVAALTLVRAWFAAGCPRGGEGNTASFEDWDRLVRQPLAWLAQEDLMWGRDDAPSLCDVAVVFAEAAAEAPHKEKLLAVLHAWNDEYWRGKQVSARDFSFNPFDDFNPKRNKLLEAIADAVGKRGKEIDTTKLGYWLKKHTGERMDGLWFERVGEARGSAAYVLRREGVAGV